MTRGDAVTDPTSALLSTALAYADHGLYLFPAKVDIIAETGKKKSRFLPDWDGHSTSDEKMLRLWFGPRGLWRDATLCIDCGKSELVVVDCDGPDGIANWAALVKTHNIGATWVVRTPSGGQHWYYRADPNRAVGINSTGKVAPCVDIRGAGGLVFAPPSQDDRGVYHWVEGVPDWSSLPVVPDVVVERMTAAKVRQTAVSNIEEFATEVSAADAFLHSDGRSPDGTREFTDAQAEHFCRPHLDALRAARSGTINDTLNTTAFVFGHFLSGGFWTRDQVQEWCEEALRSTVYDGKTWRAAATIASGLDAGARDWQAMKVAPGKAGSPADAGPDTPALPATLANLPDEFWTARPELGHIRAAAHSRGRSADLVFAATLVRLSAMVSPELQFDTGLGPGSLNLFAAAIGPSGVGKSAGAKVARELMVPPSHLDGPAFRDGIPVGSGEGLAEAYMGTVLRETGEFTAKGIPKTEKVRAQVRSNAFIYVDEGEALTKMGERSGATIGPTIRSAWVGAVLGQANAREETTRILPDGSYAMGLLIGFQRGTALPLLAEAGPGTPQRFLWCSAIDPTVPADPVPHPGPLMIGLCDVLGEPVTGVMDAAAEIKAELWQRNLVRVHGEVTDDDLDSHIPLTRSKISALLALLDGRTEITVEDWALSGVVWDTSSAVRDALVVHGRAEAAAAMEARTAARVDQSVRIAAAVGSVDQKLDRIGRLLARKVAQDGSMTNGAARKSLPGRDKPFFDDAVERAIGDGLLRRVQGGGIAAPLREVGGPG